MKTLLLACLVIFSFTSLVWAKTEKKKDNGISMSALGKIDESNAPATKTETKDEMADHAALYAQPSSVKMSFSCKTAAGVELKQGEVGYDECLRNVKNEQFNKSQKKGNGASNVPGVPGNGENATIKVEFGK